MRAILVKDNEEGKPTFHIRVEANARLTSFLRFKLEIGKFKEMGYREMWLTNQKDGYKKI